MKPFSTTLKISAAAYMLAFFTNHAATVGMANIRSEPFHLPNKGTPQGFPGSSTLSLGYIMRYTPNPTKNVRARYRRSSENAWKFSGSIATKIVNITEESGLAG
ncbi:hypothetical protein HPB52_001670 [Rhipicephalus sanguineus]|uniref:Uncharacterized protein n=1 Tax=Rhipicephalus sanguineus TaxID=34632 RepID=A0A9D4PTP1_RHISA|nr:hypothetical protein HPB52_001670 [Rhipicephalus sanguineus]